jgi:hypothetical protein
MEHIKSNTAKLICDAIRFRRRITFVYHGKSRSGEPQACGLSEKDNEVVRMNLIKGGSRSGQPEQLFDLSKMESLTILRETFLEPGPNYKKNDSAMKVIFCQL